MVQFPCPNIEKRRLPVKKGTFIKAALSALLCALMCLSSVPEAGAADGEHSCGGLSFALPLEGELAGTLEPGSYYLSGDCRLTNHVNIYGEVDICLNGFQTEVQGATTFHPRDGGTLNIRDCSGQSVVGYVGGTFNNHPLTVDAGGTVNIYGGYFNAYRNSNCINSEGTVNLYDGLVESTTVGHFGIRNSGTLTVYGGTIRGYDGIMHRRGGKIFLAGNRFIIDSRHEAVAYLDEPEALQVTAPLYCWRTDPEGSFLSSEEQPFQYQPGTAYIEFAPLTGTVTLEPNGSRLDETLTDYFCGESTPLPEPLPRDGYLFAGWVPDGDFAAEPVTAISPDSRGELHFTALWEALPQPEPTPEPSGEPAGAPAPVTESAAESGNTGRALPVFLGLASAVTAFLVTRRSAQKNRKKKKRKR